MQQSCSAVRPGCTCNMYFAFFSSHETQRNGLVLLYDMTGSGYHNFDYNLARKVMGLLKVTQSSQQGCQK